MSKYHNRKTVVDGIKFDSKAEAQRYLKLKLLEKAGEISFLKLQPVYLLQDKFRHNKKGIRAITYIADFEYHELSSNLVVVEDVKGVETEAFKIKSKIFLKLYGDKYDFRLLKHRRGQSDKLRKNKSKCS